MFVGNIIAFTGSTLPEGYLECNGAAVSRSEYADLFDVIGTTYGVGDGSTTFNLPDLSGKAALGASANYPEGGTGGEENHTLLASQVPSHLHEIPSHTHGNTIAATTPSLSHTVSAQPVFKYTRLDGNTGNGGAGSQVKRYNGRANGTMSRATSLAISDHPATACTVSGGITDCPAFDTENTGSGAAHNNMMPYLAITYLIRATNPTPPVPIEPGMALYNGCCVISAGGGYITGKTR
jgi:microcystin-dependent protein